ncbi:hypothetical protein I7X12_09270 [Halosimplex litoreum]|uniref:Yip1 domain-containing protein n=1 Tax=Halosimplex litoreum TaxID=1198301 RepID=A0A7U3WAX5_9EURY|nr:hypothetical protein [Halosimplex litoreum]QPV64770.1 hypothetical protein I7X12_09270 [Halosimplex litoreum]
MDLVALLSVASPAALAPLQTDVTGGGIFALVITFLLTAAFYAATLHLAATFFIGDVPSQRAAYAGPVPAAVSILLGRYGIESIGFVSPSLGIVIVLLATLVADAIAISVSYRISWRPAAVLTGLHFAFAAVLGFALNNIFGFF